MIRSSLWDAIPSKRPKGNLTFDGGYLLCLDSELLMLLVGVREGVIRLQEIRCYLAYHEYLKAPEKMQQGFSWLEITAKNLPSRCKYRHKEISAHLHNVIRFFGYHSLSTINGFNKEPEHLQDRHTCTGKAMERGKIDRRRTKNKGGWCQPRGEPIRVSRRAARYMASTATRVECCILLAFFLRYVTEKEFARLKYSDFKLLAGLSSSSVRKSFVKLEAAGMLRYGGNTKDHWSRWHYGSKFVLGEKLIFKQPHKTGGEETMLRIEEGSAKGEPSTDTSQSELCHETIAIMLKSEVPKDLELNNKIDVAGIEKQECVQLTAPPPDIENIQPEDITNEGRLTSLFLKATRAPAWPYRNMASRAEFMGYAELATRLCSETERPDGIRMLVPVFVQLARDLRTEDEVRIFLRGPLTA